jgi:hypothetical protein
MEETNRQIEDKKERRRLANKKYRDANKAKYAELVKKHYWEHINEPEFKQKIKDKAKRFRDKNKNKKPEYILITLET